MGSEPAGRTYQENMRGTDSVKNRNFQEEEMKLLPYRDNDNSKRIMNI